MANVKIAPVAKPKSFADVQFTKEDWDAATKQGPITVPRATAVEALRNSKGLYHIAGEKKAESNAVASVSIDDMSAEELKLMALRLGKPIRKKAIRLSDLKRVVRTALGAVKVIDDEAPADADEEADMDGEADVEGDAAAE